ncbi:hypothetical protein ACN0IV_12715 [Trabulsiella odontotermitis]|uniref:hypothetical protein n=1 Tax=Trabulsiella odontotermitis TaxID=379893 RepID=UPI003AC512D6
MKISRKMNLIIPVETEMGTAYVHATPISKEVYREHFFILGKVFSAIFTEGFGAAAGPRMAYLMLERISIEQKIWEGEHGVSNTLVNEIIRLSNLVYPVEGKGWETKPLEVAIEREIVDVEDVINEIVFFTCVSSINKPGQATELMNMVNGMWNSQISSLTITDWMRSLPTLKPADSSGETESTSSAKSSTTQPEQDSAKSGPIPE